jgi:signal transduction histidine kinase
VLGDPLHVTIGFVFVLWFLAVAEQARRASRQFTDSIRLRLEKADLVEDLRLEKAVAEEANIAKSRFLAAASHDLRQPVHALSVFVGAPDRIKEAEASGYLLLHKPVPNEVLREAIARLIRPAAA